MAGAGGHAACVGDKKGGAHSWLALAQLSPGHHRHHRWRASASQRLQAGLETPLSQTDGLELGQEEPGSQAFPFSPHCPQPQEAGLSSLLQTFSPWTWPMGATRGQTQRHKEQCPQQGLKPPPRDHSGPLPEGYYVGGTYCVSAEPIGIRDERWPQNPLEEFKPLQLSSDTCPFPRR